MNSVLRHNVPLMGYIIFIKGNQIDRRIKHNFYCINKLKINLINKFKEKLNDIYLYLFHSEVNFLEKK